jgi:P27 family predicted phage terminase small subunit
MGLRGPPKKPTELKLLQGNPGKHPLPLNEPKPKKVLGVKPLKWLTKDAREIWNKETKKLEPLGLLTEIDLNAFGRYCDFLAKWLKVKARLDAVNAYYYPIYQEQTPAEIVANAPKVVKRLAVLPEVQMYNHFALMLNRLEREFGLTPAARAGLEIKPSMREKVEVEELLFGKLA